MSTSALSVSSHASASSVSATTSEAVDQVSNWIGDPVTRTWLVERPINIAIILLVAIIAHWALRRVIGKLAQTSIDKPSLRKPSLNRLPLRGRGKKAKAQQAQAEYQLQSLDRSREARRVSRIKTLANVARSAVAIFVWTGAGILILDQLGVNIAPIIASAGVVGVALGFGAQSLVKDFLSGIFMLIEDQYGIGDTIDLGNGIFGDVEEITLRITTVRDIDGALWYVRNGEILHVANHSDEYSVARIQVPVGLSNDTEKAFDVIEQSVLAHAEDEQVADKILDTPVVNGVTELQPDFVSFRVSVKTLPGAQWEVQRILQAKVLNSMHAAGITTPYPHGIGINAPQRHD